MKENKSINSFNISDKEFKLFQDLIYSKTNITINDTKKILIVSRLSKRLRALNLESFKDYYEFLQKPENEPEVMEFINRMTTNKTDFFRENHHFEFLRDVFLKEKTDSNQTNDIRIWSAGSSIGCEVYTIAMVLRRYSENNKVPITSKLLATDLDTNVLKKGKDGIYTKSYIEQIPKDYMNFVKKIDDDNYKISDDLRNTISFKKLNLFEPFPFNRGFDVIFCRNVMIYFTREDQEKLVQKFYEHIRNGGYLIIGHSESLFSNTNMFKNVGKTIYKKI